MNDAFEPLGEAAARVVAGVARKIETFDVTDRATWLARREKDVTASVVGALLGVHEYQTQFGLYMLKSGATQEDPEETAAMKRGRLLEPVAIELLREMRPEWNVRRCTQYFRDPAARIGATPDAFADDPDLGPGIIQIKTVEPSVFRRKWRTEDGAFEPPLWIVVQAIVEAHLTGAKWAAVAPMRVSFGIDIEPFMVPIHAGLIERIYAEVAKFWRRIEDGNPPPIDYAQDGALVARLYAQDDGSIVELAGDNMLPALRDEDAKLAAEIKAADERRKAIKTELLAKMGEASVLMLDGEEFATAKTVSRKAYSVAASSYRRVQFKTARGAAA